LKKVSLSARQKKKIPGLTLQNRFIFTPVRGKEQGMRIGGERITRQGKRQKM